MGWRTFYWRWLRTAFRGVLNQTSLWAFIVLSAYGVLEHYVPAARLPLSPLAWVVPLWIFAVVVAVRALWAPYVIWREDQRKIRALQPEAAVLPDVSLDAALGYILHGRWDRSIWGQDDHILQRLDAAKEDIRQRAHHGQVKVWGRPQPLSPETVVKRDFWLGAGIELESLFEGRGPARTEKMRLHVPPRYVDLSMNRSEVERNWPRTA